MSRYCVSCNGLRDVFTDPSSGCVVCSECGSVLEEGTIVNEVTFMELGDGSASAVGQFVPASGSMSGLLRGTIGHSVESREVTLGKAKRTINLIGDQLKISQSIQESALRVYHLALEKSFTHGRKRNIVAACCLYIACRREQTSHMLLDFSEILKVDVFLIGHTFLQLLKELNFSLPLAEPWLYVRRFATQLDFGSKNNAVIETAMKLIKRMKRDWIQTGRRPAGICAAALLISARIHGFKRSQDEIFKVVRISGSTLNKRLKEFDETPAALMTPQEFDELGEDIETDCVPPAFKKSQEQKDFDSQIEEAKGHLMELGVTTEKQSHQKSNEQLNEQLNEQSHEQSHEQSQEQSHSELDFKSSKSEKILENEFIDELDKIVSSKEMDEIDKAILDQEKKMRQQEAREEFRKLTKELVADVRKAIEESESKVDDNDQNISYVEDVEFPQDMFDLDDEELDQYIVKDKKEIAVKEQLWDMLYADFMKEKEEKKKEKEQREAEKQNDPFARRRRRKKKIANENEEQPLGVGYSEPEKAPAASAQEAAVAMLKKKSRRNISGVDVDSALSYDPFLLGEMKKDAADDDDDDDDDREPFEKKKKEDLDGGSDIFALVSSMNNPGSAPKRERTNYDEENDYETTQPLSKRFRLPETLR